MSDPSTIQPRDLEHLLLAAADLTGAGLDDFTQMTAPSSDEDPPPMTGPTPESTALLNKTFTDKAAKEVRTSFVNSDSTIVIDEGASERVPGAAAAWMADMRQIYAQCDSWTIDIGGEEIVIQVVDPADDPIEPLRIEQKFADGALMRTMLAGPDGQLGQISTLLVRDGDRVLELTFRSGTVAPGSPEAARLRAVMTAFLELAPAKFLG
ncbi:hypothetical protein [Nonomuraea typhae]|uniref:Uncharacterized protein n=1 Tax=Nonomuraea typhae TaxID=2603600 RepID=A0ABW7YUP6_9ACTN